MLEKIVSFAAKLIPEIVNTIGTIVGILKKSSKEVGETDSVSDNSSLENIDHITQIFADMKQQVHSEAMEVENKVMREVERYVDELRDSLQNHLDKVERYSIHIGRIERQIDKIASKAKGTIDHELSKKISLDNVECREIVKMIPGVKKESAMNAFVASAVSRSLEACCVEIKTTLEEIYEDVEIEIIGAVESIQKQNECCKDSLAAIDENNDELVAKEQIMAQAHYLIDTCDTIERILGD